MLSVLHPLRTLLVVAPRNLADPIAGIPRAVSDLLALLPTGEQPEDLPPAAFMRFFGCTVAPFELVGGQMRLKINVSWHGHILQYPERKPYEIARG